MIFLFQPGAPRSIKSKECRDDGFSDDSLFGKLKACLSLQSTYRDALRSLRDSLGTAPNLSHFPSFSSFGDKGLGGNLTNRFVIVTHIGYELFSNPHVTGLTLLSLLNWIMFT